MTPRSERSGLRSPVKLEGVSLAGDETKLPPAPNGRLRQSDRLIARDDHSDPSIKLSLINFDRPRQAIREACEQFCSDHCERRG